MPKKLTLSRKVAKFFGLRIKQGMRKCCVSLAILIL